MKKTIKTKADLSRFVDKYSSMDMEGEPAKVFKKIAAIAAKVEGVHGRSQEARDAAAEADQLRKDFIVATTPKAKLAPKKASSAPKAKKAKKETLTEEEKAARAEERAKARSVRAKEKATAMHGDEAGIQGAGLCLCGCGGEAPIVPRKDGDQHKLFIQGHDAKLKSKAKLVAEGLLPKRVLTAHAKAWLERWHLVSNETKSELGIRSLPKTWLEMTDNGKPPKTYEEFLNLCD